MLGIQTPVLMLACSKYFIHLDTSSVPTLSKTNFVYSLTISYTHIYVYMSHIYIHIHIYILLQDPPPTPFAHLSLTPLQLSIVFFFFFLFSPVGAPTGIVTDFVGILCRKLSLQLVCKFSGLVLSRR